MSIKQQELPSLHALLSMAFCQKKKSATHTFAHEECESQ